MLLGKIENMEPGNRDAVHAAIVWGKCSERLQPGTPVRFSDIDKGECYQCSLADKQGITDPFGRFTKEFAVILDPDMVDGPLFHNFDIVGSKNEQRGSGYRKGYDDAYDEDDGCRGC